jgi:hypothetical protein
MDRLRVPVGEDDREIGEYERWDDHHPAQPAAGHHGAEEERRTDPHGEQIAARPAVDVVRDPPPGGGDLIDRLRRRS